MIFLYYISFLAQTISAREQRFLRSHADNVVSRTRMWSAEEVEIRAAEFQYGRNKSGNLAAYLNTLILYSQVHLGIPR